MKSLRRIWSVVNDMVKTKLYKNKRNFDFGMLYCGVAYNIIIIVTIEAIRCVYTLLCTHTQYEWVLLLFCTWHNRSLRNKENIIILPAHFPKKIKILKSFEMALSISLLFDFQYHDDDGWRCRSTDATWCKEIKKTPTSWYTFVRNWVIYRKVIKKCIRWCTPSLLFLSLETCLINLSSNTYILLTTTAWNLVRLFANVRNVELKLYIVTQR